MADKHLTELEWKKFAKGKSLKDAPMVKALAALEKCSGPGEGEVTALEDVKRHAQTLRSAGKGDAALAEYLDALEDTLAKRLQAARAAAKTQASKTASKGKAGDDAAEEDEDSPAVLTSGLLGFLRQVKKGAAMQAMIVTDGAQATAVMLARRAIPPTRSKLLKDFLDVSAAKPPIHAECLFEANAITFVVEGKAAGLAKKIKAALLAQTELRWKVRVRGMDPDDIDEDLEGEIEDVAEGVPEAPSSIPPAPPPDAGAASTAPDLAPLVAAMNKLGPAIRDAAAARPQFKTSLFDHVSTFQAAVRAGDPAQARETLYALAALVKRVQGEIESASGAAGTVKFEQIHLDWDGAKKAVHDRLLALNTAILDEWDDGEAQTAAARLDGVLARFDEGLGDTLDALRNAADVGQRAALAQKAGAIADRYLDYLANDRLVAHVEGNPYEIDVGVRGLLSAPLNMLKAELAAIAA